MRIPTVFTPALQQRYYGLGRILSILGGVALLASAFLPWAYGRDAIDDMTYVGSPSTIQWLAASLGVLMALCAGMTFLEPWLISRQGVLRLLGRISKRFGWIRGAKAFGTGALVLVAVIVVTIALELGGAVNVEYGGWIALVASGLAFLGSRLLTAGREPNLDRVPKYTWLEIVTIAGLLAALLFGAAYALAQDDGGTFVAVLVYLGVLATAALRTGFGAWVSLAGRRHRNVLVASAFAVAFFFPFTQNGSDANMSIATQVLIFAATAVGLNIVVGLAGLLDLGYIAFLGAGAFTAAVLSESAFATFFSWKPPFIVVMLIAGCISATLGLIIGSPTLRVSGDYLAIVTLAFGEIFRITMNNLDGSSGPNVVHGSSGIPAIPNLDLFGFNFGEAHNILGIELGRFSNYFFVMLLIMGFIILVFTRLNHSRIGRGWVAIREDERAAEAMGVNVFGLKLLAFAGGAFLAGFAGAVKAHVDVSVVPDQYVFLESAFLLAAVVLGGMGTVMGVLLGAILLKLVPEKLRFISEYRMLIFGLLMVAMMRFRPEGMIPNQRRALEFHEDDDELVGEIEDNLPYEFVEVKA
ncbi:branched-chain amino acid ABC transporter permease [Propioniciclava tarda]|uniref:Branched-chain amino acid ABC transporter permease n=1 Tax=Propioniciclava tarda TaxID=433330 RepID=A0A4Q9KK84_PROTD|nr:branched-chain amino acid ABC transporter permease [Propioniciclava tarda]TBT93046.1 branched-chain amino acid ABC transporter permease [Propioniciclava tarda]SMO81021.1 amino acid/amide ABC transporter membrane protein 2, HAAT family [Propioniciclava tarda]HOA89978.1 branched-chain amino acid ABC transporter permease [Propioniciclava tarda]HQA32028.1 branched-chain amino acid ABC transporter permease [Propioniciclava tarda]